MKTNKMKSILKITPYKIVKLNKIEKDSIIKKFNIHYKNIVVKDVKKIKNKNIYLFNFCENNELMLVSNYCLYYFSESSINIKLYFITEEALKDIGFMQFCLYEYICKIIKIEIMDSL